MNSLMKKVDKDLHFGDNKEYKEFLSNGGGSRCDSAMSNDSRQSVQSTETYGAEKVIVDLDLIVEKWINFMWDKSKSKHGKIEFEDLEIIADWKKVDLSQDDAKFDTMIYGNKAPVAQTLFTTHFTNKTEHIQEYSFKTERKTRQTCCFSFMKGFSREKEGGVNIKLPQEIVEIGGGVRNSQQIECGKDQTNEEEVSWSCDSLIKVLPKCKTSASLVITEVKLEKTFSILCYLKGRINVTLNNRRENNTFVKSFTADIAEVLGMSLERQWLPPNSCRFEIIDANGAKLVKIEMKGKCKFRLGVEQHVTVNEEKLKI